MFLNFHFFRIATQSDWEEKKEAIRLFTKRFFSGTIEARGDTP